MVSNASTSQPIPSGEEQSGYSIEPVRFVIWNGYMKLSDDEIELFQEYSRLNGRVKVKTALKALSDLYRFIEYSGIEIKNMKFYHNQQLKEFSKFMFYYFVPQMNNINDAVAQNSETIEMGQTGFSLQHYRNWKKLCGVFIEVSGIRKFERVQTLSPEMGFGAS